jgi:flagellar assembly protein FliH
VAQREEGVGSSGGLGQVETRMVIEPFGYAPASDPLPPCAPWEPLEVDAAGIPVARRNGDPAAISPPTPIEDFASLLDREKQRSFTAGRERGLDEGRTAEREAHAPEREHRAQQLARLTESFTRQRDRYLQEVEREVVKLALAVAARILRREAQMDPLLLLGAVRVALGQLAASTKATLRVPAGDVELWSQSVALLPDRALRPRVIAGESMRLGDCMLETELGTVDLGVRAQLSEIERGFFDRAADANAAQPSGPSAACLSGEIA